MDDDFKTELFVFPDGTEIEMIVFEQARLRPRSLPAVGRSDAVARPAQDGAAQARGGATEVQSRAARAAAVTPAPPGAAASTPSPSPVIPPGPVTDPPEGAAEARVCPLCGGDLVYPVDWERRGDAVWELELRCPDCETRRHALVGRPAVEAFNRDLYYGAQALAHEAESLQRQAFEDDVERISSALGRDLIQPMDF